MVKERGKVIGRKASVFFLFLASIALSLASSAQADFKVGVDGASAMKLHLRKGQSYPFDTDIVIRAVSVSNSEVADVMLVSPSQLMITGKKTGSAILVYWTEANVPSSVDLQVWEEKAQNMKEATPPAPVAEVEPHVVKPAETVPAKSDLERFVVALLPAENLSGRPVPLKEFRQTLGAMLKERGIRLLPEAELETFMARHRMRYVGGVNKPLSLAFLRETGARAVLVTSVEYYSEGPPPQISLIFRLVSTGEDAAVLWMESVGLSGNDRPGILGLGLIENPEELLRKAIATSVDSLARSLPGGMARIMVSSVKGGKFRPKRFFRAPDLDFGGGRPVTVAVVPFMNIGTRKNAGSLLELHFVDRLARVGNIRVVEPGVVREELLRLRIIMQGGLSGPQADLLFDMLDADLLVTGIVAEYQDGGNVSVGFTVLVFDMKSRRVVWSSRSYNRGDDGVFFFNVGEVRSAAVMAAGMAWAVIERMIVGNG